mmetsp:Transcript_22343/g.48815  ORF Transcript_22343/g.48815 Transcript_22343/m.48815 type:complete len:370 (+) Transcript_22343:614-1723(+)
MLSACSAAGLGAVAAAAAVAGSWTAAGVGTAAGLTVEEARRALSGATLVPFAGAAAAAVAEAVAVPEETAAGDAACSAAPLPDGTGLVRAGVVIALAGVLPLREAVPGALLPLLLAGAGAVTPYDELPAGTAELSAAAAFGDAGAGGVTSVGLTAPFDTAAAACTGAAVPAAALLPVTTACPPVGACAAAASVSPCLPLGHLARAVGSELGPGSSASACAEADRARAAAEAAAITSSATRASAAAWTPASEVRAAAVAAIDACRSAVGASMDWLVARGTAILLALPGEVEEVEVVGAEEEGEGVATCTSNTADTRTGVGCVDELPSDLSFSCAAWLLGADAASAVSALPVSVPSAAATACAAYITSDMA